MWKFKSLKGRDKWLFLLTIGAVLCILAFPAERLAVRLPGAVKTNAGSIAGGAAGANVSGEGGSAGGAVPSFGGGSSASSSPSSAASLTSRADCETALEARVRSILEHVEGIGIVDVMIVQAPEKDSGSDYASVKTGSSLFGDLSGLSSSESESSDAAIQGIIISAEGGASPTIQAEISEAMQALFGLPAHKIKVLKRVE
jgi:stage III sporulation protein AG